VLDPSHLGMEINVKPKLITKIIKIKIKIKIDFTHQIISIFFYSNNIYFKFNNINEFNNIYNINNNIKLLMPKFL